jgi:hypothetical protein
MTPRETHNETTFAIYLSTFTPDFFCLSRSSRGCMFSSSHTSVPHTANVEVLATISNPRVATLESHLYDGEPLKRDLSPPARL